MSIDPAPRCEFMGVELDPLTLNTAVDRVFAWCSDEDRHTRIIVTVNVAILMMLRSDKRLAAAVKASNLVVADGAPIVWASRWLSRGLPERVTGVDLMDRILKRGAAGRLRVFLLGTTQARLGSLQALIEHRYPGVVVVGARNGYFKPSQDLEVISEIRESRADILLIGMPAPMKEIWTERHRDLLDVPVVLGVGGSFDVLGGFVLRAPEAFQRFGMEWAWRLAQEPRKLWKRYLTTNTQFLLSLAGEAIRSSAHSARRARRMNQLGPLAPGDD